MKKYKNNAVSVVILFSYLCIIYNMCAQMIHRMVHPESHGWPWWWNSRSTRHSMELNFFQFLPNISLESKDRGQVLINDSILSDVWFRESANTGRVAIQFMFWILMSSRLTSYSTPTSSVFLCPQNNCPRTFFVIIVVVLIMICLLRFDSLSLFLSSFQLSSLVELCGPSQLVSDSSCR